MIGAQIIHRDPRDIIVLRDERQRQRNLSIDDLIPTIRARGIWNPLIVTDELVLVAGERRLKTALHLQLATVPTRLFSTLDPSELKLVELEENLRRLDLVWQDKATSFLTLHEIYSEKDPEWTLERTAGMVSYNAGWVAEMCELGRLIRAGDKVIIDCVNVGQTRTILGRRNDRRSAAAIAGIFDLERGAARAAPQVVQPQPMARPLAEGELPPPPTITPPPPTEPEVLHVDQPCRVICADFESWAATYDGPRFNLLHIDFPYGVELNGQAHQDNYEGGGYDGGENLYWHLFDVLAKHQADLVLPSAHLVFWFSMKHYHETRLRLQGMGWAVNPTPLVWHKTDNKGILPDPKRGPRQTYETAFIASLGDRMIVKPVANSYGAPTGKADAIHTNEKPEPMLNHFLSMFIDEHTRLLDPTCGSGSAIRSAEGFGAESALGLELNPEFAERAQLALVRARGMRQLSKGAARG